MNSLPSEIEDIVYVYEHNIRFSHVMNELKNKFCLCCKTKHNVTKCTSCEHSFCESCNCQYGCRHCGLDDAIFEVLLDFDVIKEEDMDMVIERINQIFADNLYQSKAGLHVQLSMWDTPYDLTYEQIFDYISWYKTFLDEDDE